MNQIKPILNSICKNKVNLKEYTYIVYRILCDTNGKQVMKWAKQTKLFPKTPEPEIEELLTEKMKLGKSGEQVETSVTSTVFRYVYEVKHNDWNHYASSQARGVDIRVVKGKDVIYGIEVKNLRFQTKPYGTDFVIKEVLTRFEGLNAVFKILVISYIKLLTKKALSLLAENHIHVYEVGQVANIAKHNPRVNPEFFYDQVERFKKFIHELDPTVSMLQQTLGEALEKQRSSDPRFFSYLSNQSNNEFSDEFDYNFLSIESDINHTNLVTITNADTVISNFNTFNEFNESVNQDNLIDNLTNNQIIKDLIINDLTINQNNNKIKIRHDTLRGISIIVASKTSDLAQIGTKIICNHG